MSRYYDDWQPYVPVGERIAYAQKYAMQWAKKSGTTVQPVSISGRVIAKKFWGKSWCEHMESLGDYANRLPRGRAYARNGSICHLAIEKGEIMAIVAGSSPYVVDIEIAPVDSKRWEKIKKQCSGKIGTLLELLQGKLSDEVMRVVTDRSSGLFPRPKEMQYSCSCPDSARMCKHIAAVFYGIGARLDEEPELLFALRGVDQRELIASTALTEDLIGGKGKKSTRRRTLSSDAMENVFGVEFDTDGLVENPFIPTSKVAERSKELVSKKKSVPKTAGKQREKKPTTKKTAPARKKVKTLSLTPKSIAKLRGTLGETQTEFAQRLGVSSITVHNWETATKLPALREKNRLRLQQVYEESLK